MENVVIKLGKEEPRAKAARESSKSPLREKKGKVTTAFNEKSPKQVMSVNVIALKGVGDLKYYPRVSEIKILTIECASLKSLQGVLDHCPQLVYLNASHNLLSSGSIKLTRKHNFLEEVYLSHNSLVNVADLVPHCR